MGKDDLIKGRSSGDRKRMYPGAKINLRPDNSELRKSEATGRLEAFSKLTPEQKLEVLDARAAKFKALGKNFGEAKRQRARYVRQIEEARVARETEKAADAARATAKKEKQENKQSKPAKNSK